MKNFKANRKNVGAVSIASRACAWILSIMLVVTGMAPSFVANAKTGKGSAIASVKSVSNIKKPSKTKKDVKDEETSKTKVEKKPDTAKKYVGASSKKQKIPKDNEDKNGKQNRIKNKRLQAFNLNSSGNVYAEFDGNENLTVSAKNTSGDMNIEKDMWWSVAKKLGAGKSTWRYALVKNISFSTNGIYLPEDSANFFQEIGGVINGCEKLNTSKVKMMDKMFVFATSANPDVSNWDVSNVTDISWMFAVATSANPDVSKWNVSNVTNMKWMFADAKLANPDVSKWNVSNVTDMSLMFNNATSANPDVSKWNVSSVTDMDSMFNSSGVKKVDLSRWILNEELFKQYDRVSKMFDGCSKLEYLKTPLGLKTSISGVNKGFKIVKLKKGDSASIEKENQNLTFKYIINNDGDKKAVYHIYAKDVYAGVIFDKNSGNTEGWVNHEIVKKGDSIKESYGSLPTEKPTLDGSKFLGWTTKKDVALSTFNENTKVSEDTTVYALWKKNQKVSVRFDKNGGSGGSGDMPSEQVEKDSNYRLPACTFVTPAGKEFDKWEVKVGNAPAEYKAPGESVVASDDVVAKAIWKNKIPKVTVTFDKNGGSGDMPAEQVEKDSNYRLPAYTFVPPTGKEFDKWEVTVGTAAPEDKQPGESVVASDNVVAKAVWKDKTPPAPAKAKVTLDGNGGVLAGGAQASIDIEKGETIRAALEAAVENNIFTKPGYKLVGFSKSKFATAADYNLDAPVYSDMTLYAVYEEINEVTTVTIKYSDIDLGEDAKIEGVKVGKPIGAKLDGNARHRDGYRFLGYSKVQNAVKPDFFKKSIVTENLEIYPVYKEAANEDKVKVAFRLNDGTDASLKT